MRTLRSEGGVIMQKFVAPVIGIALGALLVFVVGPALHLW